MAARFGCSEFFVTYATPNRVVFEVRRPKLGDVHVSIMGTGYLGLANGVTVTAEKIDASGAVLRFSPTTSDTKHDKASGAEGLSMS